ncbi:MAG: NUDIX hydrolase [Balneolaceae bacterium]
MKKLTNKKWLNLFETNQGYLFASRKNDPLDKKADAVVVVPIIKETNDIIMIKEFRPAVNKYVWSFPAGLIDNGEDPIVSAKRELKEELGLDTDNLIAQTPPILSSPGMTDERVIIFFFHVFGDITPEKGIEYKRFSRDDGIRFLKTHGREELDAKSYLSLIFLIY